MDENDRQASLTKCARKLGRAVDNLAGRVHGLHTDNAFCRSITIKAAVVSSFVRGMVFPFD
jgi:hypothetical protein